MNGWGTVAAIAAMVGALCGGVRPTAAYASAKSDPPVDHLSPVDHRSSELADVTEKGNPALRPHMQLRSDSSSDSGWLGWSSGNVGNAPLHHGASGTVIVEGVNSNNGWDQDRSFSTTFCCAVSTSEQYAEAPATSHVIDTVPAHEFRVPAAVPIIGAAFVGFALAGWRQRRST
jgi:hypothetical protein